MKPAVVLALAAGWLAATCPSSPAQLLNGSFEDPEPVVTDAWGVVTNPWGDVAEHWGRWGHWMNREAYWAPTRNGAAIIGYHHWQIEQAANSGLYQDITNVPANSKCVFTVHAYKDLGTDVDSVEVRLERCGGFEIIASNIYPVIGMDVGRWLPLTVTGVNTAAGVRVLLLVNPKGVTGRNGCLKFDDADLVVGPADAADIVAKGDGP
jgi:hypothetical protein